MSSVTALLALLTLTMHSAFELASARCVSTEYGCNYTQGLGLEKIGLEDARRRIGMKEGFATEVPGVTRR